MKKGREICWNPTNSLLGIETGNTEFVSVEPAGAGVETQLIPY